MNNCFKLVYKSGPHGDECTTYTLDIKEGTTLKDFLDSLNEKEWGEVLVRIPDPKTCDLPYAIENERYMDLTIEYNNGKPITPISEYFIWLSHEIDLNYKNWANGGWSAMDYWIKVKV